jgi:hypothetical protein
MFIVGCEVDKIEETSQLPSIQNDDNFINESNYTISLQKVDKSRLNSASLKLESSQNYLYKTFYSSGSFGVEIDRPSNIYVILTNGNGTTNDLSSSIEKLKVLRNEIQEAKGSYKSVLEFRSNIGKYLKKDGNSTTKIVYTKALKNVGDKRVFYLDSGGYESTLSTLRVTRTVYTEFGYKTLSVYVSDDSFDSGNGCDKKSCVNQEMVDILADKFLKSGSNNDIYDWETNIFGEEWGPEVSLMQSNLIGETDEIVILLTDIDGDNDSGNGTIGYFWPKDTLTDIKGSNREIMFYIDSVMYASRDNRDFWSIESKMPMETISTLAHEFQHMLSFYQKSILRGDGKAVDVWLDEILSCSVEYLFSNKIKTFTPRHISPEDGSAGSYPISDGQFPYFNKYINNYTLTVWHNRAEEYGGAYALGAYLLQNYGGAELLHNIMHNSYLGEEALLEGIKLTMKRDMTLSELFNNCGVAIAISDKILDVNSDSPFVYNTGDYNCKPYKDTIYCMGSINFFNYYPRPNFTIQRDGDITINSNRYILLHYDATGYYNINLSIDEGVTATVVVKPL